MRVLIIDDEENIRRTTSLLLEGMGHEAVLVSTGEAALEQLDKAQFDAAFLDLKLDDKSGLELLPMLLTRNPRMEVVVFTAFASFESAVEAMRNGATDYLPKPFTPDQIRQVLAKITKNRKLKGRVADLEARISSVVPETDLTTHEPRVQKVYEVAMKAAAMPATILILGESGTGKSVLARHVHENSPQRDNVFVTVSCPSLSRELLESELFGHTKGSFTGAVNETWGKVATADGGTLFLDEIGELPMEIQPKLLRLLQEKEYERVGESKPRRANVRVIAATNRNLEQAVKDGRFREDLYYRVNVVPLRMPPLRERRADLMRIASNYLEFCSAQCGKRITGFTPEVEQALQRYNWPGNLRELRNVVERAVILADGMLIQASDLPEELSMLSAENGITPTQLGGDYSIEDLENEHIKQVLQRTKTLEAAARTLGIDSATLYRKRKKLGL
ncbi:MAG TPA: sigma-54 dependent transcriptional regulator [Verrucomicrobiae bacterium]|nr:sigma-54 dependent transcriptional regulator [Verrucomicrobiae bacterium]